MPRAPEAGEQAVRAAMARTMALAGEQAWGQRAPQQGSSRGRLAALGDEAEQKAAAASSTGV